MASLRLATALRSSVHRFHLSRTRNYTVALTPSLLSRTRGSVNSPTLSFIKAHVSTTADAGTSTSKDVPKIVTSSPSTNTDSSVGVEPFGDGNSNGGSNGTGVVGNGNGNGPRELQNDWSKSYHGLSSAAFAKEVAEILQAPVELLDIEMKPDGLVYLPEIKYRRILNKAFGPGGWGLAPRSETHVGPKIVSREYALVCQGRLVAISRGEQEYFDPSGVSTATEGCKSNALMRCCKDLGIASELWDPRFIREFKAKHCVEVFVEHLPTKKKKKLWRRRDQSKFGYPYQE